MAGFDVLDGVTSPPLAAFKAMAATLEARLGPPAARDLDSNGVGLFDAHCLRFCCGLEVVLWRFHLDAQLRTIDPAVEPSRFEIHASQRDLEHIAFHLEVPVEQMDLWTDPLVVVAPRAVVVMRTDDNANEVEVKRVTSRCEAESLVQMYEARGHKQSYWILDVPRPPT
jgi:hypothetical protein